MAALITTPGIYDGVELNNVNATASATETRMRVKEDICSSILRHLDDRLKDLSQDSILARLIHQHDQILTTMIFLLRNLSLNLDNRMSSHFTNISSAYLDGLMFL